MGGIGPLWQLIAPALIETLYMAAVSTALAYLIGLPLGVVLVITSPGHVCPQSAVNRVLGSVINALRSAPFVILMVALIPLTRLIVGTSIGSTAAIVPLVVSATPFVARLVESALREVPFETVEAALVMGATPWQVISKVLLPEALPSLILGTAISGISIISYTTLAGAVGGGGLGDLAVQYGYNRFRTDIMIVTLVILILIVQAVQQLGNWLAAHLDKRH